MRAMARVESLSWCLQYRLAGCGSLRVFQPEESLALMLPLDSETVPRFLTVIVA